MDKRTITGFALIMAILILWPMITQKIYGPRVVVPEQSADSLTTETVSTEAQPRQSETPSGNQIPAAPAIDQERMAVMKTEPERIITVETKELVALLSSRGGTVKQIILKDYIRYDDANVAFMGDYSNPEWARHGALTLGFEDSLSAFNDINYIVDGGDMVLSAENPGGSVKFTYLSPDGLSSIAKEYIFHYDDFIFDLNIDLTNRYGLGMNQGITLGWFTPMEPTEKDYNQDNGKLGGFFSMGEEFDYFAKLKDGKLKRVATGPIDWAASRSKYFTAVIMANDNPADEVIVLGSQVNRIDPKNKDFEWKQFGVGLTYNNPPENTSLKFSMYTGPLEYYSLKARGNNLSSLVDMGWKYFRPFSIAILWFFTALHKIIPNYGFVIIIFSVLMKLVFWPLSHKSAKSMHKMREIQPKLQEIKEKFKNDPGKLQAETMKAYKEFGVNPFGSCLPMLIQLPVFWAMYAVLGNSIELRGAPFIWWIKDLSRPDPTGELFLIGIGVLPIIMGLSMFIQQKMTITDPKQKMMIYLMPALFTFLFSRWASGLVLYWTMFNIMGIFEQWFVKKRIDEENNARI